MRRSWSFPSSFFSKQWASCGAKRAASELFPLHQHASRKRRIQSINPTVGEGSFEPGSRQGERAHEERGSIDTYPNRKILVRRCIPLLPIQVSVPSPEKNARILQSTSASECRT